MTYRGDNMNDTRLLDVVDELTQPSRRKILQDTGEGIKTVTVHHDPLLQQLDEAIRSSMGGTTKGAALAFESAVLNTAALFAAMKISSQIGDWCRMVRVHPSKDSTKDLRAWYTARLATNPESDEWHIRQLSSWVRQIRGLLDPPRERDLPDECPTCGAQEWWDPKTGTKYLRPLVIQYRPSDADMIQQARALCRACEKAWGVRELAYELEQRHAENGDTAQAG